MKSGATDKFGRLHSTSPEVLQISVSRALLPRALRIADALFRAIEDREWVLTADATHGYFGDLLGESIMLSIFGPSVRKP